MAAKIIRKAAERTIKRRREPLNSRRELPADMGERDFIGLPPRYFRSRTNWDDELPQTVNVYGITSPSGPLSSGKSDTTDRENRFWAATWVRIWGTLTRPRTPKPASRR